MSSSGNYNVQEQLAAYRLRKKKEEENKAFKQRLWNSLVYIMTLGARSTDSPSPVSTKSSGTHDKPEISSEETDAPPSRDATSSEGTRKRAGLLKDGSSGMSTDNNDVNLQATAFKFFDSYTMLDWFALGLKCLMWLLLFKVFILIEFGAVYFILSAFIFMWYNMRSEPKKRGEVSAYSVFNPNCESIDGTFTAEQFERELLHKM